jgi:hypothetical protein
MPETPRVLIADDDALLRSLIEFKLSARGYQVISAALVGLGDALREQLRDEEARSVYERGAAVQPASADVRGRLAEPVRPRWRLDVDGSYRWLTGGRAPWREGSLQLAYRLDARTVADLECPSFSSLLDSSSARTCR